MRVMIWMIVILLAMAAVFTFKNTPASLDLAISEQYCEVDEDCACGVHAKTGVCFGGNKNFVNTSRQCPDFCISAQPSGTNWKANRCVNNTCSDVFKPYP